MNNPTIQFDSITIQQFQVLTEIEKVDAIMQYGCLLTQNFEDNCRVFLYQFDGFYVITKYLASDDQLKEIKTFTELIQAIPHIRSILISTDPAGRAYSVPEK